MDISKCSHCPPKAKDPRSDKCEECNQVVSLRYCLTCGHVGCCDSSSGQHARKHAEKTKHEVMSSYPKSEQSFTWCYAHDDYLE